RHFTAPRTGTIKHVRLVSCVKGSFRLQLAWAHPAAGKAKIAVNGPEIKYHGQSPCGGASGEHYVVQSFKVKFRIKKGEYVAIKARSTGTLSCSGGNGFLLYAPPLPVGGPFKKSHSWASCDLLVQLSYKEATAAAPVASSGRSQNEGTDGTHRGHQSGGPLRLPA